MKKSAAKWNQWKSRLGKLFHFILWNKMKLNSMKWKKWFISQGERTNTLTHTHIEDTSQFSTKWTYFKRKSLKFDEF